MLIGYARVSTQDQHLDLQLDALKAAGCDKVFTDKLSGSKTDRPGLAEALSYCRQGDCLVVWKLDRLGRSLPHLVETVADLKEKGIDFRSCKENIDTSTATGKLIFHIFAALAEFERDCIRDRTQAGLTAARERGRVGGRPKTLTEDKISLAKSILAGAVDGMAGTVSDVAKTLGVSRATVYRSISI